MKDADQAVAVVDHERLVGQLLEAIETVVGRATFSVDRPLVLHEPSIGGSEEAEVIRCLHGGWVSSAGPSVNEFERLLAEFCGVRRVVACVNGTAALHLALLAAGVVPGDEVLVPAISFVATANAVRYCGAEPNFVDVGEADFGIDPGGLRRYLAAIAEPHAGECRNRLSGRRISALVPVHCFGYPCAIEALAAVAEEYGLALVEDAAEALGSTVGGRAPGTFGRFGALSFNGNKLVTTGGGGAVLSDDDAAAGLVRHLSTTAKRDHPWRYFHDQLGFNYRLPSINAALGIAQLGRIDAMLESKRALHESYRAALSGIDGVRLLDGGADCAPNHWLNTIVFESDAPALRDRLLEAAHARGLKLRPVWHVLADLPYFAVAPRSDLAVARSLESRTVSLPSSAFLGARG